MNTPSKHGLRAAATERRTKHAQRTPLPTQRVSPEAVQSAVETRTAAIRTETKTEPADLSKSATKGKAFSESITPYGWTITPAYGETDIKDHVTVTATRGIETIFIEWMGGVYQPTATYVVGDRRITLRNASQAKQYASRSAETASAELERVASNRFFRKRETPAEKVESAKERLPFDVGTALDDEIFTALAGKRVTWHNRFREESESAVFPVDPRPAFVHITEHDGERILNFCCPQTGFRSLRLSALLSVSRGKSVTAKRGAR